MKIKQYRSDGKKINRPARIVIKTIDIANYCNTSENYINLAIYRNTIELNSSSVWDRFWSLVTYLEKKGLRPTK